MPVTPSASYSLTLRIELDNEPGMLGEVTSAIGEAGGSVGAIDIVKAARRQARARHHGRRPRARSTGATIIEAVADRGRRAAGRHRPHLQHARGRQDRAGATSTRSRTATTSRWPTRPGVARVCRAIHDDPDARLPLHDQAQLRGGRLRRLGGARPRRHRPARRDAGDGGQGDAAEGVRRRRRVPDLPRHEGRRTRSSRR